MNYEPHKKLTHLKNDMNIIIQMFLDNPGIILILQYFFFSKFSYLKISIVPIFLFITEGLPHDVLITFGILLIPSMIEIELLIEISTIVSKLEYPPPPPPQPHPKDVLKNDPNINDGLLFTFLKAMYIWQQIFWDIMEL